MLYWIVGVNHDSSVVFASPKPIRKTHPVPLVMRQKRGPRGALIEARWYGVRAKRHKPILKSRRNIASFLSEGLTSVGALCN